MSGDLRQPVLLIGADGMLGRALRKRLEADAVPHHCPTLADLDLTRPETIESVARGEWPTIINCAAWTDVDGAEEHEAAASAVNATGAGRLAEACREGGALLVHYSTDYVFDGSAVSPYPVDAPRRPVGAYGRTKAEGEELIERSGCEHLIVRTSWLYAPWGKNFVRTIAGAARIKPELRVVNDQRGRPTSAEHLAGMTLDLVRLGARGTLHVADGPHDEDGCTWFEFAREIVRLTGAPCEVRPCTTAEYPRRAKRPAYSVLDLSETWSLVRRIPSWRENLADVVRRLEPIP